MVDWSWLDIHQEVLGCSVYKYSIFTTVSKTVYAPLAKTENLPNEHNTVHGLVTNQLGQIILPITAINGRVQAASMCLRTSSSESIIARFCGHLRSQAPQA